MLSPQDQYRIYETSWREFDRWRNWVGLNELRATVMDALGCSRKDAERKIREARAGLLYHKWADPPPDGREPPRRDPRWATVKIKWRKGLVLDEFTGSFEWRELLVYRESVAQWLQELAAAPSPAPAEYQITRSNDPAPVTSDAGENKSARYSNAAMVEALWRAIGDPAHGIGIKGAQDWIAKQFKGFAMSQRVLGYHLARLRKEVPKQ